MMDSCIFCRIAAGEIPSATIYEDETLRAILDLSPAAEGHTLVLPKAHYADSCGMPEELLGHIMATGARIGQAQKAAFGYDGFHLLQNNGPAAGQSVFHFHLHVIPRREGDAVMPLWKPGESTPEGLAAAAQAIRRAMEEEA